MWQPARLTEAKHQPSLSAGDWSSPPGWLPHVDRNMATSVMQKTMVSGTLQETPRETYDLPGRQQSGITSTQPTLAAKLASRSKAALTHLSI